MRRWRSVGQSGGLPTAAGRASALPAKRGAALAAAMALMLSACAETVTRHGHLFQDNDLAQISPGMSQEQVKTSLGTPTTTAPVGKGLAYYYISSTESQALFLAPKEKDRTVVAVYFTPSGAVDRVAQYGLKDGKVFDYVKNETPVHAKDEGILKALFRNLGVKQLGLE